MYPLIPKLVAAVLLVLGLSCLLNARGWLRLYRRWAEGPHRLFPTAIVMLASGLAVGLGYDAWNGTWPIFVTLLGWLLAAEGAFLLLAPDLVRRMIGSMSDAFLLTYLRLGGTLLAVLGISLGRHALG